MKKSAFLFLFCLAITIPALAEDDDMMQPRERRGGQMRMDDGGGMGGMMRSGEGMGGGMMGGKGMDMMKGGMRGPSSMVAVGDGSIVVLSGNKLTKYDGDLNLMKTVEIESGPEGMKKPPMGEEPEMGGPMGPPPSRGRDIRSEDIVVPPPTEETLRAMQPEEPGAPDAAAGASPEAPSGQ